MQVKQLEYFMYIILGYSYRPVTDITTKPSWLYRSLLSTVMDHSIQYLIAAGKAVYIRNA